MTDQPVGEQVLGELVSVEPTAEEQRAERDNRKARTAQQTFSAAAVVTVLVWVLRLNQIDLNPQPGQEEIPGEVVGALTALLTFVAAWWMNRERGV